ncbi:PhnA protein [Lacibacter luteus]|uniref:PhnA protein n=1 Tax=Lacibacter luteus TaxID=2508719 RepID=A0A4Q1CFY0_9BACT|nr:alkylphosphonate utilization protein [Lacibacter luteus]RXK58889.1 PhnA protein [Lacibacter luteus]
MKTEDVLRQRSGNTCELCKSEQILSIYEVPPQDQANADNCILVCDNCLAQIEKKVELNNSHWNCLTESMWSEVPAVQVVAWRMLNRLRNESWAADNLDMLYLNDEHLAWAKATGDHESDGSVDLHRDCNGAQLLAGDTVVLIKSLDVKGSTLNAKMGTVVKNIRLVPDNTEQIEGKIEGQTIVILTKYVRKQNEKQ